jgi:hypothetical protein
MNAVEINKKLNEIFGDRYSSLDDIADDIAEEITTNDVGPAEVEELKLEPLDDEQMRQLCGPGTKIILNGDLSKYDNIEELLPTKPSFFILLYGPPSQGHWVLVARYGTNTIEYFNSYGGDYGGIDHCTEWYANMPEEKLEGGATPHLSALLEKDKNKYEIIYNVFPFQDLNNMSISTCGRWCALRWRAIQDGISLRDFIKIIKDVRTMTGMNNDQIVADLLPLERVEA